MRSTRDSLRACAYVRTDANSSSAYVRTDAHACARTCAIGRGGARTGAHARAMIP